MQTRTLPRWLNALAVATLIGVNLAFAWLLGTQRDPAFGVVLGLIVVALAMMLRVLNSQERQSAWLAEKNRTTAFSLMERQIRQADAMAVLMTKCPSEIARDVNELRISLLDSFLLGICFLEMTKDDLSGIIERSGTDVRILSDVTDKWGRTCHGALMPIFVSTLLDVVLAEPRTTWPDETYERFKQVLAHLKAENTERDMGSSNDIR